MKDPRQITPAEFQILQVLWRREGAQSVGQVLKELRRERELAYTTVMTLLDKLARKGSVARHRKGKAYLYRPAVERRDVLDWLIQEFADNFCSGRRTELSRAVGEWADDTVSPPGKTERDGVPRGTPAAKTEKEDPSIDIVLL